MNVYMYVELNYAQDVDLEDIIPQHIITDYLRSLAWNGATETELIRVWRDVYAYIFANLQLERLPFDDESENSISEVVIWLINYAVDFRKTPKDIKRFLQNINDLIGNLSSKGLVCENFEVRIAYREILSFCKTANTMIVNTKSNVINIDFVGKNGFLGKKNILNSGYEKCILHIREHLLDLSPKTRDILFSLEYKYRLEKSLFCFKKYVKYHSQILLNSYIAQSFDEKKDFSLSPYFIIFAEYFVFNNTDYHNARQPLHQLVLNNKFDYEFTEFLKYYSGVRFVFFKVLSNESEYTCIEDIVTNKKWVLKNIFILHSVKTGVFGAYFKNETILPTFIVPIVCSKLEISFFTKILREIWLYKNSVLGESLVEFCDNNNMLVRYLLVVSIKHKNIYNLFKKTLVNGRVISHDAENIQKLRLQNPFNIYIEKLNISPIEIDCLLLIWHDLCLNKFGELVSEETIDIEELREMMTAVLCMFIKLNYPEELIMGIYDDVLNISGDNGLNMSKDIEIILDTDNNKARYLTELGWIKHIENFLTGGISDELSKLSAVVK